MEVRLARGANEVEQALSLRERVFCGEQGVDLDAERDGRDRDALHVVALEGGRVVGTCRLLVEDGVARLGRMAVEPERRRSGVGAAILAAAEREARDAGAARVALHAQTAARGLYERGGYVQRGDPFVEEGIDHVTMERALA
ncbi:MAG TPA: GNAT family N-acetyltransferase [Thermoleophilaceae bacterium]|jgi:predicted GNAT family N-acyltransferase